MTITFKRVKRNTISGLLAVIMGSMLANGGTGLPAQAQGLYDNNFGIIQKPAPEKDRQPKLRSGRFCATKAVASLKISNSSASVTITGQYPDQRGYKGNPRSGFSGEGFSIIPVNNNTVRITQHQYGATRNFKRC